MIPFAKIYKLSGGILAALSLSAHAVEAPKHVDVKQLSKKVEDVVVPLPNEVFGALNKLGGVNWREYVRNDKGNNFTERPRIALLLGVDRFMSEARALTNLCGNAVAMVVVAMWEGEFDRTKGAVIMRRPPPPA